MALLSPIYADFGGEKVKMGQDSDSYTKAVSLAVSWPTLYKAITKGGNYDTRKRKTGNACL